jgi:transposase-like protein
MSVQLIPHDKERRRNFTPQQKLQILKEWEGTGNGIEVAQKYQILYFV